MDVFKTEPCKNESIHISDENFSIVTKKDKKYYGKNTKGEISYYAVCPLYDNPIVIVGLYKKTIYKKHGRHHQGDIENLADYDEDAYLGCPYHSTNTSKDIIRRKPNSKSGIALYKLLKEQFDRIIYMWNMTTGIQISQAFARQLLESYVANEGWLYYGSTYNNLSYMLLYAERAYTLFGRKIIKGCDVYNAILHNAPNVNLVDLSEDNAVSKIKFACISAKEGEYLDIHFYIEKHRYTEKDEHLLETFELKIIDRKRDKIILSKTIEVEPDYLRNLINLSGGKGFRNKALLAVADELLK